MSQTTAQTSASVESSTTHLGRPGREALLVLLAWLLLAVLLNGLALRNVSAPGLNYDEAVYGHFTRDFLFNRVCEQHMPGSQTVSLFGKPFPLFVQGYLGAVKC